MIYFNAGHSFSLLGSIAYLDIFSFNTQLSLIVSVEGVSLTHSVTFLFLFFFLFFFSIFN